MSSFSLEVLQKGLWEFCHKDVKCDYPCGSCYGCENHLKLVEKWLRDLRYSSKNAEFDTFTKVLALFSTQTSDVNRMVEK